MIRMKQNEMKQKQLCQFGYIFHHLYFVLSFFLNTTLYIVQVLAVFNFYYRT